MLPHSGKKLWSRDVAAVSRPPCFEPRGSKVEDFGLETEVTFANEVTAWNGQETDAWDSYSVDTLSLPRLVVSFIVASIASQMARARMPIPMARRR